MIPQALRIQIRGWLGEAVAAGARYTRACAVIGLSARCMQRWRSTDIDARSTVSVRRPHLCLEDLAR